MQRFDWSAIPKTTREDVALLVSARDVFSDMLRAAGDQLAPPPGCTVRPQVVGYGGDWSLPASESLSFQLTSEDLCVSVRFAAPLALAAVDGILGKAPDRAQPARVLTPIELGVFEYCLLDWLTQARTDVATLSPPVLANLASPAEHLAEAGPVLRLHCAGDYVAGRIELRDEVTHINGTEVRDHAAATALVRAAAREVVFALRRTPTSMSPDVQRRLRQQRVLDAMGSNYRA